MIYLDQRGVARSAAADGNYSLGAWSGLRRNAPIWASAG
jgi:hypothetical protein